MVRDLFIDFVVSLDYICFAGEIETSLDSSYLYVSKYVYMYI